ncbi:MAG: CHAD domain-containing protein [Anaerolineales bacterium]|nr:CHAD domain-containing protein [Anaerolineales bacterium]
MSENNATQPCTDNYRISRNDSIPESGRRILSVNFDAIVNNEMGTIKGDYDALHDMRVATRRLRMTYDFSRISKIILVISMMPVLPWRK